MENGNIDKAKLYAALNSERLKNAVEKKDMNAIFAALSEKDAAELKSIISDKEKTARLLSSPQAQAILRALEKNGK